jgi:hypothetical protein
MVRQGFWISNRWNAESTTDATVTALVGLAEECERNYSLCDGDDDEKALGNAVQRAYNSRRVDGRQIMEYSLVSSRDSKRLLHDEQEELLQYLQQLYCGSVDCAVRCKHAMSRCQWY